MFWYTCIHDHPFYYCLLIFTFDYMAIISFMYTHGHVNAKFIANNIDYDCTRVLQQLNKEFLIVLRTYSHCVIHKDTRM